MKTKLISPWRVRPGQHIVLETMPRDIDRTGSPRSFEVLSVTKDRRTVFTGTAWRITYADNSHSYGKGFVLFHGKTRNLPAQKVAILA